MAKARRSRSARAAEDARLRARMNDLFDEIEHGMRGYMLLLLDLQYKSAMRARPHRRRLPLNQFFRPADHRYPGRRVLREEARR